MARLTGASRLLPWSWAPSLAVGQRMDVSAFGPDDVGKRGVVRPPPAQ
jgi:hypothetical protein